MYHFFFAGLSRHPSARHSGPTWRSTWQVQLTWKKYFRQSWNIFNLLPIKFSGQVMKNYPDNCVLITKCLKSFTSSRNGWHSENFPVSMMKSNFLILLSSLLKICQRGFLIRHYITYRRTAIPGFQRQIRECSSSDRPGRRDRASNADHACLLDWGSLTPDPLWSCFPRMILSIPDRFRTWKYESEIF